MGSVGQRLSLVRWRGIIFGIRYVGFGVQWIYVFVTPWYTRCANVGVYVGVFTVGDGTFGGVFVSWILYFPVFG